jgi:hypothetical protein
MGWYFSRCRAAPLLLLATALLPACRSGTSCTKDLRDREQVLARQLDSVLILRDVISAPHLRSSLEALRADERVLLDDARQCRFGLDVISKHYWQRGRLKLPSRIELALEALDSTRTVK